MNKSVALSNVIYERKKQDRKWGIQDHTPFGWMTILLEEVGEANKALLNEEQIKYRNEMVQVAAVALAAVESYDRQMKSLAEFKRVKVLNFNVEVEGGEK